MSGSSRAGATKRPGRAPGELVARTRAAVPAWLAAGCTRSAAVSGSAAGRTQACPSAVPSERGRRTARAVAGVAAIRHGRSRRCPPGAVKSDGQTSEPCPSGQPCDSRRQWGVPRRRDHVRGVKNPWNVNERPLGLVVAQVTTFALPA